VSSTGSHKPRRVILSDPVADSDTEAKNVTVVVKESAAVEDSAMETTKVTAVATESAPVADSESDAVVDSETLARI
jgi:hypothetical protein